MDFEMEPLAFERIPTDVGLFPFGTRLFDVAGLPVCWLPVVGGGFVSLAWDVMPPRLFSAGETFRRGKLIDATRFETLRARYTGTLAQLKAMMDAQRKAKSSRDGELLAQSLCDNVDRNVMAETARDAGPAQLAAWLAGNAIRRAQLRARRGKWPA